MLEVTKPTDLPYLTMNVPSKRGKVLAVVTSCNMMGKSKKSTGYELTELSRAYYVFQANGYEVDIASPKGGTPPVIIDDEDMGIYDHAFLNDSTAQRKVKNSIATRDVLPDVYDAVYFVGGKGAMFDFPQDTYIQSIVKNYYHSNKVIGAVCHGPAALINVNLNDGSPLLANKSISSFTNQEELFLIPDAESIFPFLLESQLVSRGAQFNEGIMYLKKVSVDGKIVTGQNPWSTWEMAERMVEKLGYEPKPREHTPDENTIDVLYAYEMNGYAEAKTEIMKLTEGGIKMNRTLLAMHGIVSAMQWEIGKAINLIRLLAYAKDMTEK